MVDSSFHPTQFRTNTDWEGKEKKALAYSYLLECAKGKSIRELIRDELFASESYKKISEYRWYLHDYNPGALYLSSNFEQTMYVMHRHHWINRMAKMMLDTQVNDSPYYARQVLESSYYKDAMEYADSLSRKVRTEFEIAVNHYISKWK